MGLKQIDALLDRPIAFHPAFVAITGSITAALMLSQAWYWKDRTADPAGWFYKTQREWQEETGLTRYEQETARRVLKDRGLLEEKTAPPYRLYFRVDKLAVYRALGVEIPQAETPHGEIPQLPISQKNEDAEIPQVEIQQVETPHSSCSKAPCQHGVLLQPITENTAEITTGSTERVPRSKPEIVKAAPGREAAKIKGREKDKEPADSAHHRIIAKRVELFGATPNMGREAKAVKWMLDREISEADIIEYMGEMARAAADRGFAPSLDLVARQIEGWRIRKATPAQIKPHGGFISQADINSPLRNRVVL